MVLLTLGTGIGSAILTDGKLVPNTVFGHMMVGGKVARGARLIAREGQGGLVL